MPEDFLDGREKDESPRQRRADGRSQCHTFAQRRTTFDNKKPPLRLLALLEETAPLSPLTTASEFILFQKLSPK